MGVNHRVQLLSKLDYLLSHYCQVVFLKVVTLGGAVDERCGHGCTDKVTQLKTDVYEIETTVELGRPELRKQTYNSM